MPSVDASWVRCQNTAVASRFDDVMAKGYAFSGDALHLGAPLVDGAVSNAARVSVPLSMMNRHGLVAGATGTGKTKTLQLLAEQLSPRGVPVFLADLKGDLSGLGAPGEGSPQMLARAASGRVSFTP